MTKHGERFVTGPWLNGGPQHDKDDARRIRLAFKKAREVAESNGWKTVWLVTADRENLRTVGTIGSAIGAKRVRDLYAGTDVDLGALTLRYVDEDHIDRYRMGEAVLAVFPTREALDRLDEITSAKAVIAVPMGDDAKAWIDTWGPTDIETGEARPRVEIDDADVRDAVYGIVANKTGVSHPGDQAHAKSVFSALRAKGRAIDPAAIRAYARREPYWSADNLDALAGIARDAR